MAAARDVRVDPRPGEVWEYFQRLSSSPTRRMLRTETVDRLEVVRPGRREGDWIGTDGEEEWLIPREQLIDGCWRRVDDDAELGKGFDPS